MKTSVLSRTLFANRISLWIPCAFALTTSVTAQVTPIWTFESPQGIDQFSTFAVRDAISDAAGNVIVVGHHHVQGPLIAPGPVEPYTMVFHRDGSSWMQFSPGPDNLSAFGVAVSPIDGSVYTAEENYDQHKISVTKRTSAGTFVWRTPSVPNVQYTEHGCLLDDVENTYVASTSEDPPMAMVTSWDSAGALRFSTTLPSSVQSTSIVMDPAGDLILVGGGSTSTIAKVSRMGVVLWSHSLDMGITPTTLVCDASGGFYAMANLSTLQQFDSAGSPGWGAHTGTSVRPAVDRQQCVVVCSYAAHALTTRRFDPNGNLLWQRDWSVSGYDFAFPAAVSIDGAGNSLIAGMLAREGYSGRDPAYLSYTPSGELRWSGWVGLSPDQFTSEGMVVLPDGAFSILGEAASSIGYAPKLYVSELQAQSIGLCFGDASSTTCPCSNDSAPGDQRGCANSAGTSARLADSGIASVTNDTLVLTSSGETPAGSTLVFQGTTSLSAAAFGDGLRCVGGSIRRLYSHSASAGVVSVPQSGDASISARSAAAGDVLITGSKRYYQARYRDANLAFCPAPNGNAWNVSSALLVTWAP